MQVSLVPSKSFSPIPNQNFHDLSTQNWFSRHQVHKLHIQTPSTPTKGMLAKWVAAGAGAYIISGKLELKF